MTSDKNAPYWEQDIAECLRVAAEIIGPNSYYLRAAEYIDELRAECERLRKNVKDACDALVAAEAREREAYEWAAKVASEKISEYSGNDACAVYVANILRSLAGERREG